MILNVGEYVHIIHRQLFQSDAQRHFVGTVEGHEGNLIRVKGYLFAMDSSHSQFVRREQLRTRVVALDDSVIVNVLPSSVKIDHITYTHRPNGIFILQTAPIGISTLLICSIRAVDSMSFEMSGLISNL